MDKVSGMRRMLDFVISDPTSQSSLLRRSFDDPNTVNAAAERAKFEKYKDSEWAQFDILRHTAPYIYLTLGQYMWAIYLYVYT
jgi:hypothetical protein